MKKSKFSDTQIVSILKQAEAGMPVKELRRPLSEYDTSHAAEKSTRHRELADRQSTRGFSVLGHKVQSRCPVVEIL